MLSETIGFTAKKESIFEEGENIGNGKDTSSTGSYNLEEPSVERPRAARTKTRTRSVSPRKRTRSPTKKLKEIKRRISTISMETNEPNEDTIQENDERMDISSPEN